MHEHPRILNFDVLRRNSNSFNCQKKKNPKQKKKSAFKGAMKQHMPNGSTFNKGLQFASELPERLQSVIYSTCQLSLAGLGLVCSLFGALCSTMGVY